MKLARFIKDVTGTVVAMTLCVAMIAAPIATQAQPQQQAQQQDPNMQGPPPQGPPPQDQQQGPPPSFAPAQLDQIVGRIALYPDSLLAQAKDFHQKNADDVYGFREKLQNLLDHYRSTAAGDEVLGCDHASLDVTDRDQVLGAITSL